MHRLPEIQAVQRWAKSVGAVAYVEVSPTLLQQLRLVLQTSSGIPAETVVGVRIVPLDLF